MNENKLIEIYGPDQLLYQWDKGQKLLLQGYGAGTRVDFSGWGQNQAVSVYAYQEDGAVFCDIPDTLLMEPNHLWGFVYETDGDRGEIVHRFALPMIPRLRPDDYVEPEELPTWHELARRMVDLEGEGLAKAVEDYLKEHSIQAGATEEEAAQIARNKANIEQLTQNKLDADRLDEAVSNALAQAKESGAFDGAPGVQGPAGPKGDKGDTGSQGPRGADGEAGLDGKSAYAYARDGGYTGTEAEFAAKLAKELPDALPNPHPLTINGKAYDGSEAVDVMITGGTAGGSTSLGQTPVTLTQSANIKLSGDGEYSYTIKGKTVADLSTVARSDTMVTVTEKEGYVEIAAAGASSWTGAHADIEVSGLTPNTPYTLYVKGTAPSLANKIGGSYFIVRQSSGTQIAAQLCDSAKLFSIPFTPDSSTVKIIWYPANNYYWNNDCKTSRIEDFYINKESDGTERTGVINESGTFTASYSFGQLPKGVTITSEPSCEVYSVSVGGGSSGASAPLDGKTVVCFGDSLFGMYSGNNSAPAYVAKYTGATVHNVGFGGCRMSEHPYQEYDEFCMYALANAVASGDWSAQDAAVANNGSANFPEHLALLKSIDFDTVDAIVIHYGTNDFAAGEGVAIDNASNPKATNTLCGALRYSVETLLTAYPHLNIFISLPAFRYWTADNGTVTYSDEKKNANGNTLPDFVKALAETAKEYNLPVIDCYYGLGINRSNATAFLTDGTHHNVEGRKRFGEYIGSKLISGGDTFIGADSVTGSGESGDNFTFIDVTAKVGQTIVVDEVDANGKPTKWSAMDYQPRTHWQGEKVMLPETAFEGVPLPNTIINAAPLMGLTAGHTYIVNFDGINYTCVAEKGVTQLGNTIYNVTYIGNPGMVGGAINDIPFVCADVLDYTPPMGCVLVFVNGMHTVSVTGVDETNTIPDKYVDFSKAFALFIDVYAETSVSSEATYTCYDTIENVESAFAMGRDIKIKVHIVGDNKSDLISIYDLSMYVSGETLGASKLIFTGTTYSIDVSKTLVLSPQEDGTYSVTGGLGD